MTDLRGCRVAVIGARGIGKHHAKWWALEGAEVVAFAGACRASLPETAGALRELFGFQGRAYDNVDEMLAAESPDVVDVCSPDACHYAHVRTSLEAGSHVLCEKPFVYDSALDAAALLAQAHELEGLACAKGLLLGLCTQYVLGMRFFLECWRRKHGAAHIEQFRGELASPDRGNQPTLRDIWVDLAPHPLSMLQELLPGGSIDWPSVRLACAERSCEAGFSTLAPGGARVACEIVVKKTIGPPMHIRSAVLNGCRLNLEGGCDNEGTYCARIMMDGREYEFPDPMRLTIRAFMSGAPAASGRMAVRNLEWLLGFMDKFPVAHPHA